MEKRYQTFVSSTYNDLREERKSVVEALLNIDCMPTGMEAFPAADDDSWTLIQKFIEGCDYCIIIVGGRYGSIAKDGLSFTEMEYDYAVKAKIPTLAFLHSDPGSIAAAKTEPTDAGKLALQKFRKKIEDARHSKYWSSPAELAGAVALGMTAAIRNKPRRGWVRAEQAPDESAAVEIVKLRRRIDELEGKLAEADMGPPFGTEALSQGDEKTTIRFRFQTQSQADGWFEKKFSWNDLVSILGPILIDPSSETNMKNKLKEVFYNYYRETHNKSIYDSQLVDEDFQSVKLQLRALGIIREVRGQADQGGKFLGWGLTPYGDRLMTQVAAIRSQI